MRVLCGMVSVFFIQTSTLAFAGNNQNEIDAFLQADRNGDKYLNKSEFKTFVQIMAEMGRKKAERAVRFGDLGYAIGFTDADANSDGILTPAELERLR